MDCLKGKGEKRMKYLLKQTAEKMVKTLMEVLEERDLSLDLLDTSSAENLLASIDDVADPSGEVRCESFWDLAWDYAENFGELGDNEFINAQWRCVEEALLMIREM